MALVMRDDMGRDCVVYVPPRRIVSLVPSETYNVCAVGAADRLVGRTRFCVEPAAVVAGLPEVGGTKDVDAEAVAQLAPDLVLANQEENSRPPLEWLAQHGFRVFVSFPRRFADGVAHLARLARILDVRAQAAPLVRRGYRLLGEPPRAEIAVFVPIWMEPLMTMSGGAFGSDVLASAGARNVFGDRTRRYPLAADLGRAPPHPPERTAGRDVRYPRVTLAEVEERAPELVLLPDEPYAFSEADAEAFRRQQTPAAQRGAIARVDGKDLFWPGAWTIEAMPRLRALIAGHAGRS